MPVRKLCTILFVSVLFAFEVCSQTWELRKEGEGVKVYTRKVNGSDIQEFKGEVIAKSNLSSILSVIDNVSDYPKWMYKCTYAERLLKKNESSGYTYSVLSQSWPVSDRDLCTFYNVSQDPETKVISIEIKCVRDYIPEKPGKVRIPKLKGSWQLIPLSKGVTKIVYQVHSESGGYIPSSVVNSFITDTPYYNLLNLKKIVESPLCPKKVMENVKEL